MFQPIGSQQIDGRHRDFNFFGRWSKNENEVEPPLIKPN